MRGKETSDAQKGANHSFAAYRSLRLWQCLVFLLLVTIIIPSSKAAENPPVKADLKNLSVNGQLDENKARLTIEADLSGFKPAQEKVIFATALQHSIRASLEKLSHSFRLQIDVIQGELKEVPLVLSGSGDIRQVTGEGLQDWSIRQEAGGSRFLVLRLKPSEKPPGQLTLTVTAETPVPDPSQTITPLTLTPAQPALFNGFVRVDYEPVVEVQVVNPTGLVPVELSYLPEELKSIKPPADTDPMAFRFQGSAYSLPLKIAVADPEARQVVLRDFKLEGRLSGDQAGFVLNATARVKNPRGGTLDLLSGSIALAELAAGPDWRLKFDQGRFLLVTERPGEFPLRIVFNAAVRQKDGWNNLDFRVAPGAVEPVVLHGLAADTQFEFANAAKPERHGSNFVSFLPANGVVKLAWKETRPEAEGKLFYSAEMLSHIAIAPGLMRQTALIEFKVMQGELSRVALLLQGEGEVTRVQGAGVLAWNVEPSANPNERRLVVQFNQAQKDQFSLQVQMQTPLGAFPQAVTAMRLRPESATRFAGYLRIVNEGAVRLEVLQASGASQISPEQFPESDATKAAFPVSGGQRFAFRFSGADYQLRIQADNILPELSVSQVLAYHLGETELAIDAEIELDIREAPLRELLARVPKGYAIARLNAPGLNDYFTTEVEGQPVSELRLVYGQQVAGRQVIQLRLERNQPLTETNWALPPIEVLKAKSVRGHLAAAADPGFRLTPALTQGVTEIATAFFPRKVPGLQTAFRISEPAWQATLRVERLPQSIQADAMHLFSVGEGIAYGSSVINYVISGAPLAAFRVELSDEYFNVEFTGKDIRNWRKIPGGYAVQLHTPVAGAFSLLVTYERPFKAQGATLAFTGARPLDAQSEQGHTLVISTYQFEVKPVNVSAGLTALEPAEVPAEYRLFFDAPILAAYRYNSRPFTLQLELSPLAQGDTLGQVVDRAALTTRISKEGQVLTDARYYVKNRGLPHFRLKLPEGTELWAATVNGATVVPVKDAQANLIPLPQRADPNAIHQLDLKLASRSPKAERVTVAAPVVFAPLLLTEWRVLPDAGRRLVYRQGTLTPAGGTGDISGFAGLVALFSGDGRGSAATTFAAGLALIVLAVLVWRWSSVAGTYRFSARQLVGAAIGLIACVLGIVLLLQVADLAGSRWKALSGDLTLLAPVQQGGSSMSVEVDNLPRKLSTLTYIWTAWPAALALAVWIYSAATSRRRFRPIGVILGWTLLFWAVLRWPNGTPAFFVLLIVFLLVQAIFPALRRLWQLPRRPRPAPPSEPGIAPAAAALVALLFAIPVAHAASPKEAPPAETVAQEVRVEGKFAFATAKIQWHAIRDQMLPLLYEPAVLTGIVYPTNALKLVPLTTGGKRGHQLLARETGVFEVELNYQVQVGQKEGESGFALPTQYGLVNRLQLTLANLDVEVRAPQAVSVRREFNAAVSNTVATLVLPPVNEAWIGWKPRSRDPSREKAVFYAEWFQLYVPAAGVIEGVHQAQIRPAQGELSELAFEVPAGATITDVLDPVTVAADPKAAQTSPAARSIVSIWRFDPDTRKLRVSLNPPQAKPFSLVIKSQVATGPLPFEQKVGLVAVNNAAGQIGLAGIATGTEVQLDRVVAEPLSPINLEDFPPAPLRVLQTQVAGLALRRAYRYTGAEGAIALRAVAVEPDVRVEAQTTLSLGEDRTVLAANLAVEITRAGIFRLSFALPAGLEVETISGAALSHWTELKTEAGRMITLHLRGKTEGKQEFAINLSGPGVRPMRGWAAPKLVLREAGKQQGQLLIVPEQGLRLQIANRDGLTQLDPQKAGIRQKGVLAFRLLHSGWTLTLDLEQVAPWIQVASLQHVNLGEAQTKVTANLQYQIENTGLKSLRVTLPADAEGVRFRGEQMADFLPREGQTNAAAKEWEVKLHRRIIGKYLLQVTYQRRLPEQARETTITGVQARGVDLQRGFLTLQAGGRLAARVDRAPATLQPAEWQSIPRALQQDLQSASASYAYRLVEPNFELPVRLERHEAARLLPARVNGVTLTSVIADNAEMLTQATLEMIPGDKRLLRLRLPAGARFWFAFVNQHSVWPWLQGDELLIPLEQQSRTGQAITVELFYSSQVGAAPRRLLEFELWGPKVDLPLENITWRVFLNEKWRLKDWAGTLQLKEKTAVAYAEPANLEIYLQKEAGQQQAKTREAGQLLELGNSFLQKGDPQQARRAFQAAYGISTHDDAFNEDARVQLHNLKLQQALVGLNVRQAATGGDAGGAAEQAQDLRGRKVPAYTQQEAKQILDRNSAEENAALTRLAERLIQQQDAAVANPAAIHTAIPEQGRLLTFTRAVLVDPWANLTLNLKVSHEKTASWLLKALMLAGIFAGLALFAWLGRRARA